MRYIHFELPQPLDNLTLMDSLRNAKSILFFLLVFSTVYMSCSSPMAIHYPTEDSYDIHTYPLLKHLTRSVKDSAVSFDEKWLYDLKFSYQLYSTNLRTDRNENTKIEFKLQALDHIQLLLEEVNSLYLVAAYIIDARQTKFIEAVMRSGDEEIKKFCIESILEKFALVTAYNVNIQEYCRAYKNIPGRINALLQQLNGEVGKCRMVLIDNLDYNPSSLGENTLNKLLTKFIDSQSLKLQNQLYNAAYQLHHELVIEMRNMVLQKPTK